MLALRRRILQGLGVALVLVSCAHNPARHSAAAASPPPPPISAARSPSSASDSAPARPKPVATAQSDSMIFYQGKQGTAREPARMDPKLAKRTLTLNFVEAPAVDVARTVVNAALDETLSVANGVQGKITLTSPKPVPAQQAMDALEAALSESGLALVHKPTGYLLTTLADAGAAPTGIQIGGKNSAGYGASLVPDRTRLADATCPARGALHRQASHDDAERQWAIHYRSRGASRHPRGDRGRSRRSTRPTLPTA